MRLEASAAFARDYTRLPADLQLRVVAPENIWMFDDIPSSLKTAKEVGFSTVLVGNGLRESGFVDLHTDEEYATAPEWCDYAAQDIAKFIGDELLAE